eukprot:TRINITY_DN7230_c0_g1_i3.p2 TRINITY_DN7230_c0_g1~~TRINITY_DN7230_c0_g1_i3.p2  ORF type:complete len:138 (-),score=34.31 TRINITY_DN7230_c0_g1_i3:15-428(-)
MSPRYIAGIASLGSLNRGFGPFNFGADSFDMDTIIDLVRRNKATRFLKYFPRWVPIFVPVIAQYHKFVEMISEVAIEMQSIEDQKQYFEMASKHSFDFVLMGCRDRPKAIQEYLSTCIKKKFLQIWKKHFGGSRSDE